MLILFFIFFLFSIFSNTDKRLWYFVGSIFIAGFIISIFQILNIIISLGLISVPFISNFFVGNLVGSWNNFGLIFGLIVLLSVFTIEFIKSSKIFSILQYFLFVIGLIFLIVINIPFVWFLVGLFSIIIFVYSISAQYSGLNIVKGSKGIKKFPFPSLVTLLLSILFLVGSNSIGLFISNYVDLSNTEVRPSIATTSNIALSSIKYNPILGTGPNTFSMDWALWQPKEIAQTIFWNIDFSSGFSTLSTFTITTGILGLLVFLLFLIVFVMRGIQSLRIATKDSVSNYFILTTLMISLYSWITFIIYTPSILILMLAFASSGVLIGILVNRKVIKLGEFLFLNDPRKSFFTILGLMFVIIATLSITYSSLEKISSTIYFSKGLNTNNSIEGLTTSESMINRAVSLNENDLYYRTLSQVYVAQIGILVNDSKLSGDTLKSNLQQLINLALNSASSAINKNPKNYLNYLNIGNVYSSLAELSVDGSYDSASISYQKAQELAPNNPSILLSRAQLEFVNKNNEQARAFIAQALDIKLNYTDALFLLSQIDTSEGKTGDAIKQIERASSLNPNDSTIFFRLGFLRFNNSEYQSAASAFEQAVLINPSYWNARYFLGLSYQKLDRKDDALTQFNIVNKFVPDNSDVKSAIESISNPVVNEVDKGVDKKAKLPAKKQ